MFVSLGTHLGSPGPSLGVKGNYGTKRRNGTKRPDAKERKKERKKERTAHVGSACGVVQKNDDTRRSFGGRSSRARHERAVSMKARSTLERDRAVGGGASAATVAFAEPREFSSDAKSVEMFRATFDRVPCVFGSRPKGAREISTDMAPVERLLAGVPPLFASSPSPR